MQHMPHKSLISTHKTWIGTLSDYVDHWRRTTGMSREAVAEMIISKYQDINKSSLPGVKDFANDKSNDIDKNYEARRVNADRVFRWLDDKSKDSTLLPTNFIPTVLLALPDDLRIRCANDLLRHIGMVAQEIVVEDSSSDALTHFRSIIKESADAELALAELLDGETVEELIAVQQEINELELATSKAKSFVSAKLANMRNNPLIDVTRAVSGRAKG